MKYFKVISNGFVLASAIALVQIHQLQAEEIYDPLEPVNRGIFWFNDKLDVYVLEPVARGYDAIVPEAVDSGITNFFLNIKFPIYLINDLLQLKFTQAAEHTGRFLVNSTVGVAGFIDIAKDLGLAHHREDFGITLAHYGIGPGFYLVIPLLGPSNLRDGIGTIADGFADPVWYASRFGETEAAEYLIPFGIKAVEYVDIRADMLEAVEAGKESAFDYYLFAQGAYYQYRRGLLYDGAPPEEEEFE